MSDARESLGRGTATVLRVGTLVAMLAIGGGFLAALLDGGASPGPTPIVELAGRGGADAIIGIGLLGLTLIPVAALGVAFAALGRNGERGRALTAGSVLLLLGASLVAAALIGSPS
jgi:hypothetical protein